MARGTIGGFLLGTAVAVGGASVVSVMQTLNAPLDVPQDVSGGTSGPDGSGSDVAMPDAAPVSETPLEPQTDQATSPDVGARAPEQPAQVPGQTGVTGSDAAGITANDGARTQPSAAPDAPVIAGQTDTAPAAASQSAARPATSAAAPDAVTPGAEIPAPAVPEARADMAPKEDPGARPQLSAEREPAVIVEIPTEDPPKRPSLPKVGETVDDATPRIGTPATRLTDKTPPADAAEAPDDTDTGTAADDTADQSPLQRYAAPFENPENKPLMSIILMDRGDSALGVEALAAFPYPLTFAVDVTSVEARSRMDTYRAAGFEVMALTDIPLGATGGDTETLLRAGLSEVPEAVAVMEGDGTGVQSDKAVSDQLTAVLQESGHGAVFFAKGLNTAQKLASKNGVAAASVFRDFDGKGQSATVMRRFLDQAAFKARQQPGGVVMLGRLQPETISALLLWGLQDRATRVALAPISALLLQAEN